MLRGLICFIGIKSLDVVDIEVQSPRFDAGGENDSSLIWGSGQERSQGVA